MALMMASCSDFLDVDPHNKISDAAVWSNIDLANAALSDCYRYVEGENEQGVPFSVVIQMMFITVQVMQQMFIAKVMFLATIIM